MEKKKWKRKNGKEKMIKVKQAVKFTYLYFFKTLAFWAKRRSYIILLNFKVVVIVIAIQNFVSGWVYL